MKNTMLSLPVLLFLSSSSRAWGFHDAMEYGTVLNSVTPRHCAMNGPWALPSSDVSSLFLNPAELSLLDRAALNANFSVVKWEAEIESPCYSTNFYDSGNSGTFTLAAGMPLSGPLCVAAGLSRVSDFGYDKGLAIFNELQGEFEMVAVKMLESSGSLWEANASASTELADWIQAGASIGVRFGNGSYTMRYVPTDASVPEDTTHVEWDAADLCTHVGFLVPLPWATFAASATNATERYRSRAAFGFQQPSEYHHTALTFGTGAMIFCGEFDIGLGISWRSRSRSGMAFPEPNIS